MLTDEEAKATQEIAKTARGGLEVAGQLGSYFGRFIGGPLHQVSGLLEDKLKFMRFERAIRYQTRTLEMMRKNGMDAPTREVPPSFLVGVLEAGSLEENDDLQDVGARLLVNAADANNGSEPRHAFISMLKDMSPLDAQILDMLVHAPAKYRDSMTGLINTNLFPDDFVAPAAIPVPKTPPPPIKVVESLANLKRLGCVVVDSTNLGPGDKFDKAKATEFGQSFVNACTLRSDMTE